MMNRYILALAQRLLEDWTEGRYDDTDANELATAMQDAAQAWLDRYRAERRV